MTNSYANDIALHICPLHHVGEMQVYFILHLMVGGATILAGRYDAQATIQAIEQFRVTTLFAVPTQI